MANAQEQLDALDPEQVSGTQGVYLELYTRPEWFMPEHFELTTRGIRLASVVAVDDEHLRIAVFVPFAAFEYFEMALQKYRSEMGRGGVNPAYAARIERIDKIQFGADLRTLWTDPQPWFPLTDGPTWWEVWLFDERAGAFAERSAHFGVELKSGQLAYPGLVVRLAFAARSQLEKLNKHTSAISELRRPTTAPTLITKMEAAAQADLVDDLVARIEPMSDDAPAVCLLDTGVNGGHPLLRPAISPHDVLTWQPAWGAGDRDDHGTAVSSTILYGDLRNHLGRAHRLQLSHGVESVKIFTRFATGDAPELYGVVIKDSVALIESNNPERKRVFASAIVSEAHDNLGLPSEWSAELDRLAAEKHRLFVIAAGNVDEGRAEVVGYPVTNDLRALSDPGQAWNAITVGGYTERTHTLPSPNDDFQPLAPTGGLSPASRTSVNWDRTRAVPIKPDVVCEAGNYAFAPGADEAWIVDDYSSIASAADFRTAPLRSFAFTSSATGELGLIAGRLVAEFPELWPEAIRALVVHSAEWTPFMRAILDTCRTEDDRLMFLRRFGHGVPNLARALHSARSDATMIAQGHLSPFRREDGAIKTNEAVVYRLPWPVELLEELGEAPVEMKVTLSYFIEPNPGRRGWQGRYSYPSHGLRFKVKRPDEREQGFFERINLEERDDEYAGAQGRDQWDIGRPRDRGSAHSDVWRGRAADLARCGILCVHPVSGWWRYLPRLRRWNRDVRYALVVSLRSSNPDIDIYTPITNVIETAVTTEIELE
ncbi:MAG: S8 family peptidase [Firmicutes bacterium]|nr:S8 family peptidase [Bacillota bacterium]